MEISKQDIVGAIRDSVTANLKGDGLCDLVSNAIADGISFTSEKPVRVDAINIGYADKVKTRLCAEYWFNKYNGGSTSNEDRVSFMGAIGQEYEYTNCREEVHKIKSALIYFDCPVFVSGVLGALGNDLKNYSVEKKDGLRVLNLGPEEYSSKFLGKLIQVCCENEAVGSKLEGSNGTISDFERGIIRLYKDPSEDLS